MAQLLTQPLPALPQPLLAGGLALRLLRFVLSQCFYESQLRISLVSALITGGAAPSCRAFVPIALIRALIGGLSHSELDSLTFDPNKESEMSLFMAHDLPAAFVPTFHPRFVGSLVSTVHP